MYKRNVVFPYYCNKLSAHILQVEMSCEEDGKKTLLRRMLRFKLHPNPCQVYYQLLLQYTLQIAFARTES